jgi:hypothetical protein
LNEVIGNEVYEDIKFEKTIEHVDSFNNITPEQDDYEE